MNLIPRNTLVAVVEIKEAETINDAGIVLPAQTRNTFKQAEVVSVGGGMDNNDEATRDLKPGYRVLVKLNKQSMRPGLGGEPVSSFEPIGMRGYSIALP